MTRLDSTGLGLGFCGCLLTLSALVCLGGCQSEATECGSDRACEGARVCEGGFCIHPSHTDDADANAGSDASDVDSGCEPKHQKVCFSSNLHWEDSCGVVGAVTEFCNFGCDDGACRDCQPDCSERSCGEDPYCGVSCGSCSESSVCRDGSCVEVENKYSVEIDGESVVTRTDLNAHIYLRDDKIRFAIFTGDEMEESQFHFYLRPSRKSAPNISCSPVEAPNDARPWYRVMLPADVPAEWRGETFHDCSVPDNKIERVDIDLDFRSDHRIAGTFELRATGEGERDGETIAVNARFDLTPEPVR